MCVCACVYIYIHTHAYMNLILGTWIICTHRDPCTFQCLLNDGYLFFFLFFLLSHLFFLGDLLVNPDQPRHTIPIAQIAPDLILADLPRNIMLNNDELEFDEAPEFLLGKHYFVGVFYRAYVNKSIEVSSATYGKHSRDFFL